MADRCYKCKGEGEVEIDGIIALCPACQGTGERERCGME